MEPDKVTIRMADEKRREAERQIAEILRDLEARTGVLVYNVRTHRDEHQTLGGTVHRTAITVEVKIEI